MGYGNLSKREIEIVKMIRAKVPKVTHVNTGIRWWQLRLRKYRKYQIPAIGIKDAIDIVVMVREELNKAGRDGQKSL